MITTMNDLWEGFLKLPSILLMLMHHRGFWIILILFCLIIWWADREEAR